MTNKQTNNNLATTTILRILNGFLINGINYCPYGQGVHIDETYLYTIASRNKLSHLLFHCLRCSTCSRCMSVRMQKQLSRLRMNTVAKLLLYEKEREAFRSFLCRKHIHAVEFKCFRNDNLTNENALFFHRSADLDVLVSKKDFRRIASEYLRMGYTKKTKGRYKEIQLVHPVSKFEIDLHFLLAYPHYGGLNSTEYTVIKKFTNALLERGDKIHDGFISISREHYILSLCIRYWYNDMLCGLYSLYELMQFCYTQRTNIRWEQVFHLADMYSMRNEMLYILKLGNRIFGAPLPREVIDRITYRIRVFSCSITIWDIVIFPPISKWYHKRFRDISHKKYTKFFILKILINQRTPLLRCMRPRILAFVFISLCRYIYHHNNQRFFSSEKT